MSLVLHTEKSFRNFIESIRNQILFTMHRLIWNQTLVRLDQINPTYTFQPGGGRVMLIIPSCYAD